MKVTNRDGMYVIKAWSDVTNGYSVLLAESDNLGAIVQEGMSIEAAQLTSF